MSATHVDTADCAKLVRAHLKREFPGVKFSVRSKRYSGGSSITVYWTDGPTAREVERVCKLYQGASFDGMLDLKSYHSTWMRDEYGDAQEVHMGADYVFTSRDISDEWKAAVLETFARVIGRELKADLRETWTDRVPLAVDHTSGQLYHMVEAETEWVQDVFYRFVGYRQGGSVDIGPVEGCQSGT